ncbi:SDR family NAD(P)-dependent oxidoreductase [Pseudonocardia sp. GCM10023141]|uniref:SDR family NAD(P)-dependent oxidoreductase n=1 Tax=Pseudonocardia sp. GCM10023141 TaxID=3252653 RepID=UPI00361B77E3
MKIAEDELRFDGRVAIVTGAGRGIGRAYATLLAARGSKVVVNDLGGTRAGVDGDPGVAESVAAAIRDAGGEAVADGSDIATADGAAALVDTAVASWGRVDVLVNNAGIYLPDAFPDIEPAEFRRYFDVHVGGSFAVTRRCWPHMVRAGYGRVVMTTSHGMLGSAALTSYGAAKGAVFALARALAMAGGTAGILVNSVAPVAATRMTGATDDAPGGRFGVDSSAPSLVAPLVALLCHESCAVTGETFLAGGRRQARLYLAETPGYVHPGVDLTPEDVAAHWAEVLDTDGAMVPTDTLSWLDMNAARLVTTPVGE